MLLAPLACLDSFSTEPVVPGAPRTVQVDGRTRSFRLMASAGGSAPAAGRPLLLVYHGSGGSSAEHASYTDFPAVGNAAGMIVAYLDAADGTNARWSISPSEVQTIDDLAFTRAVIDAIGRDVPIDRRRIFAAGFSRGGDLVAQIACRDPSLLRAIAPIASTRPTILQPWCDDAAQAPLRPGVWMVLGSDDPNMPWDKEFASRMGAVESADAWAAGNGCPPAGAPQSLAARSGYQVTRWPYAPCNGAEVYLYRVSPLGHFWPSAAFNVESVLVQGFLALAPR